MRDGADACERVGDGLAAAHIIARPHQEVEQILPRYPDGDIITSAANDGLEQMMA